MLFQYTAHCVVLNLARCSIARARASQCLSGPLSFGNDAVNVNGKNLAARLQRCYFWKTPRSFKEDV
jgi:hypothetical protein